MTVTFREALVWHMDREQTKIVDLAKASGVTRDVINKLLARPQASTTPENALLIAAYYGKNVNQFMNLETVDRAQTLVTLFGLLLPAEQQLVSAQIEGILRNRSARSDP